ncbi:MAG TPA: serine protease [Zeimonas sp.]|nr:serine protease [Zeimonas sp.]
MTPTCAAPRPSRRASRGAAVFAPAVLLALLTNAPAPATAQRLPDAPTPVPGSLLDRDGRLPERVPSPRDAQADDSAPRATKRLHVSSGSGFYVATDGHLVTNHHVVDGCARLARGDGAPLELVASDEKHDLALLKGPAVADAAQLRVAPDAMQGEAVLTYGYPLQGVLSSAGQLGAGMVSALAGLRDHPGHLQIDVPVQPGNSGGPLLDRRGLVVGVVVAKLNALRVAQMTGDIPQNINFAVKLEPLKALLDANGVRYEGGSAHAPVLENQDIAMRARAFTTPVFCAR